MHTRTFPHFPALALLLSLVVIAPFALSREAHSDGAFVDLTDVTYVGTTAGGATITITVDEAHTGVLRAAVTNLTIYVPPGYGCGGSTSGALTHYSPVVPITGGAFSTGIPLMPVRSSVVLDGALDGQGGLSGSVGFHFFAPPNLHCYSPTVPWTATGTIETAPDANDLRFNGTIDAGGSVSFWVDHDTNTITALLVDGYAQTPCTDFYGPLSGRTFYQPPLAVGPGGSASFGIGFAIISGLSFTGTMNGDAASGNVAHSGLAGGSCETTWTATRDNTDTDQDGCIDPMEASVNPALGGGRNPKVFWDFYDVPTMPGLVRNKSVTISDTAAVVARFGANSLPPPDKASALAEALTTPPAPPAYHTAYDRSTVPGLRSGPPDGAVGVSDISLAVMQFGAICA